LAANNNFIAIPIKGGGGPIQIIEANNPQRVSHFKKIVGHKGATLDMKWCPHDDYMLATASEDNTIRIWKIDEGGLKEDLKEETVKLFDHKKKVSFVDWHFSAAGILASSSYDQTIKTWDLNVEKPINTMN